MKCQCRILGISWHQFVQNEEIAARTGLFPLSSIDHHLLPPLSHLRTPSKTRWQSSSSQGTPQLHQVVSGTPPRPYMERSSWSSTWQVDRPAPKRQQPPTCWSMEAGYKARSRWKSDATVKRLPDLTWMLCLTVRSERLAFAILLPLLHREGIRVNRDWTLMYGNP